MKNTNAHFRLGFNSLKLYKVLQQTHTHSCARFELAEPSGITINYLLRKTGWQAIPVHPFIHATSCTTAFSVQLNQAHKQTHTLLSLCKRNNYVFNVLVPKNLCLIISYTCLRFLTSSNLPKDLFPMMHFNRVQVYTIWPKRPPWAFCL